MSEPTVSVERPALHPRVEVAQVGDWWTYDAPSLRVAGRDGHYVSIWSVGAGPSILLVPATPDHGFWVPALSDLLSSYTVHAMNRRESPSRASWEQRAEAEERDIVLAAWAVGAWAVAGYGVANEFIKGALRRPNAPKIAVLCGDGIGHQAGDRPFPASEIVEIEVSGDQSRAVTFDLGRRIREALDAIAGGESGGAER